MQNKNGIAVVFSRHHLDQGRSPSMSSVHMTGQGPQRLVGVRITKTGYA